MVSIIRDHWENSLYEVFAEIEVGKNYWMVWIRDRDRDDINDLWTLTFSNDENYQRLRQSSADFDAKFHTN